jgi:hypothetical protein
MEQLTSAAAQVIIAVIPIVGIVMGAVVVFFYLLWNHRRQTLLIKAGNYNRPVFDLLSFSLLAGILLLSVGVTLTVFLSVVTFFTYGLLGAVETGRIYGLLGGIIPLAMGIGLLVFFKHKYGTKAT